MDGPGPGRSLTWSPDIASPPLNTHANVAGSTPATSKELLAFASGPQGSALRRTHPMTPPVIAESASAGGQASPMQYTTPQPCKTELDIQRRAGVNCAHGAGSLSATEAALQSTAPPSAVPCATQASTAFPQDSSELVGRTPLAESGLLQSTGWPESGSRAATTRLASDSDLVARSHMLPESALLQSTAASQELRTRLAATTRPQSMSEGQDPGTRLASTNNLVQDLYRDARLARQQLDAKRGDLVTAMQALQQTEQALREVLHDRQSKHGEIRLMQHKITQLESDAQAEHRQSEEAERQREDLEQRCLASEHRHRTAEAVCEELREKLLVCEGFRATAERRSEEAQRSATESQRQAAEHLQGLQRAQEVEQQVRLQAEEQLQEAKLLFAEKSAQQQKELRRTALRELQALSLEQQALRTELRRAAKPPPAMPHFSPALSATAVHQHDFPKQELRDDALERARARVAVDRGVSAWQLPKPQYHSTGGSLLSGKVRKQADFLQAVQRQWRDEADS